jgi:hypothetical protein
MCVLCWLAATHLHLTRESRKEIVLRKVVRHLPLVCSEWEYVISPTIGERQNDTIDSQSSPSKAVDNERAMILGMRRNWPRSKFEAEKTSRKL